MACTDKPEKSSWEDNFQEFRTREERGLQRCSQGLLALAGVPSTCLTLITLDS